MKKIIFIVIFCLVVMLMMMPVSVAYAQDTGTTVSEEESIPQFTDPLEEEIVPETCHPQTDNV